MNKILRPGEITKLVPSGTSNSSSELIQKFLWDMETESELLVSSEKGMENGAFLCTNCKNTYQREKHREKEPNVKMDVWLLFQWQKT